MNELRWLYRLIGEGTTHAYWQVYERITGANVISFPIAEPAAEALASEIAANLNYIESAKEVSL